ncbi:DUF4049 domain-containing protein [Escherichia coli]
MCYYINNTTDFRPKPERIFICGETLKCEIPAYTLDKNMAIMGLGRLESTI